MNRWNHVNFLVALLLIVGSGMPSLSKPLIAAGTASVTKQQANFTKHGPLVEPMKDGSELIDQMRAHAEHINDYSLEFEMTVFKKGSTVKEKGIFQFKKPRQIRLEETGEYKNGAVAVIGADGKARGHYGGALRFAKITLSPDDPQLKAANGYPLKDADFLSLTNYLKRLVSEGARSRVSEQPVAVDGLNQPAVILEIYRPDSPHAVLKRVFVNPSTWLPTRWDDLDYADPSMSQWKNVKMNSGLSDDLFKM